MQTCQPGRIRPYSAFRMNLEVARIDDLKPRLAPVCYISGETQSEICCRVARLDNEACESSGEGRLDSRHYRERDRSGARDDPDLYARQLTPQPGRCSERLERPR